MEKTIPLYFSSEDLANLNNADIKTMLNGGYYTVMPSITQDPRFSNSTICYSGNGIQWYFPEYDDEEPKMKINPKEFEYEGYYTLHGAEISEEKAQTGMSNYRYRQRNPLLITTIDKVYELAGPDPRTEPTKRKFYNCSNWYHDWYDGRYGQTSRIEIEKSVDISSPELQQLVLNMTLSGDFTLQEALYAVAEACERCRAALTYKYCRSAGGYPEDSEKYKRSGHRCRFCRGY